MRLHLKRKHEDEPDVIKAVQLEKNGAKRKADAAFQLLYNKGIYQHNETEIRKEKSNLQKKRSGKTENAENMKMCVNCNGFISSRYFYKHAAHCGNDNAPLSLHLLRSDEIDETFKKEVLNTIKQDEVGKTILNSPGTINFLFRYGTYYTLSLKNEFLHRYIEVWGSLLENACL